MMQRTDDDHCFFPACYAHLSHCWEGKSKHSQASHLAVRLSLSHVFRPSIVCVLSLNPVLQCIALLFHHFCLSQSQSTSLSLSLPLVSIHYISCHLYTKTSIFFFKEKTVNWREYDLFQALRKNEKQHSALVLSC